MEHSYESFAETANALLRAQTGRPKPPYGDLLRAAKRSGWPYTAEYLRQMLSGDREPTCRAMEIVAPLLGVQATIFREYRIEQIHRWFAADPQLDERFYPEIAACAAELAARSIK